MERLSLKSYGWKCVLGAIYMLAFAWIFAWYYVWMHNSSMIKEL